MSRKLRALGYVCSAVVLSGLLVQRARAELAERLLLLGQELAQLAPRQEASPVGLPADEAELELNGQRFRLSALTLPAAVSRVLEGFERGCQTGAPELTAQLRAAAASSAFSGVLQERVGASGVAVCLAQPSGADLTTLTGRLSHYAQTGDVSSFGQLRYMIARPTPSGESHVLVLRSDGPLRIGSMFPSHGDAAGSDLAGLPRPNAAERVLSARVSDHGRGQAIVAYRVSDPNTPSAAAALRAYASSLVGAGYREEPISSAQAEAALTTSFVQAHARYIVHATPSAMGPMIAAVSFGAHDLRSVSAEVRWDDRVEVVSHVD